MMDPHLFGKWVSSGLQKSTLFYSVLRDSNLVYTFTLHVSRTSHFDSFTSAKRPSFTHLTRCYTGCRIGKTEPLLPTNRPLISLSPLPPQVKISLHRFRVFSIVWSAGTRTEFRATWRPAGLHSERCSLDRNTSGCTMFGTSELDSVPLTEPLLGFSQFPLGEGNNEMR
jgi:hypothetical protein